MALYITQLNQKESAFILMMSVLVALMAPLLLFVTRVASDNASMARTADLTRAFYLAESGVDIARSYLMQHTPEGFPKVIPITAHPDFSGGTYEVSIDLFSSGEGSSGDWEGWSSEEINLWDWNDLIAEQDLIYDLYMPQGRSEQEITDTLTIEQWIRYYEHIGLPLTLDSGNGSSGNTYEVTSTGRVGDILRTIKTVLTVSKTFDNFLAENTILSLGDITTSGNAHRVTKPADSDSKIIAAGTVSNRLNTTGFAAGDIIQGADLESLEDFLSTESISGFRSEAQSAGDYYLGSDVDHNNFPAQNGSFIFIDGDLNLSGNNTFNGFIIVNGSAYLSGTITMNARLVVNDHVDLSGTPTLRGSILAGPGGVNIAGNTDVIFDPDNSDGLDFLILTDIDVRRIAWEEVPQTCGL